MVKVGVVGGTGYTGVELLRLLVAHPKVQVQHIFSRTESGKSLVEIYPSFSGLQDSAGSPLSKLVFENPELENLEKCDLVFFATPNGVAMNAAEQLLAKGVKVIDLAADFRFKDVDLWQQWYQMDHACPELLDKAVYGLPEMNRESIRKASLVGSAGCYTTAAQLALLPVLKLDQVDLANVIVDAKSGTSGAGKSLKASSLYSECGENFAAYAVSGHRHQPEICHSIKNYSGKEIGLTFVPHLLPMVRGIFATTYIKFKQDFELSDIQKTYQDFYQDEYFVDVLASQSLPATKEVRASNLCRIALHKQGQGTLIVLSVIDNLVKGASGQAIQNMNLMFGFDEKEGLLINPLYP